ncbi:TadE/TadG family type IV pilus assembly protein [Novosphingobium sp.]|uniref:TadE/TadG family type IV pilus assembly protein n=1 Tax=Novosphingobium sp. TaxID=1874826 RepID=UPI0025FF6D06|nr:pilus assembly protein TadG-related protein [Novosphingobium sp.]
MAKRRIISFLNDQRGAVAATYAMALVGLVVIGGVGFDYGRLMAMDSELQNGADQAALAGATQLDGKSGACSRAAAAAIGLVTNKTLLANDSNTISVANETACDATGSVRFWQDKLATTAATGDANAKFIELDVDVRTVRYAFTPLTSLLVGTLKAGAMAGLGSSVCKVPPVFMCNPAETATNLGPDFDTTSLIGHGIKLLAGSPTAPGNFGFLDSNGGNATSDLAKMLGYDQVPFDCVAADQVGLNPGQKEVVFNAFNTRFDIDTNGANTCPGSGTCSAALNSRKDLIRKNQCGTTGNNGWQEANTPYRPTSATAEMTSGYPDIMGHPRDMCHAVSFDGSCSYTSGSTTTNASPIGDGSWDRNAYFKVNYGLDPSQWQSLTGLGSTASRYAVYQWEKANTSYLASQSVASPNGGFAAYSQPVCRTPQSSSDPDRRRFVMAVVNCLSQATKIAGNGKVDILKWVDVFLVEPAFNRGNGASKRTTDDQVYVEVIGGSTLGGGGSIAAQTIRRDVPYLVH